MKFYVLPTECIYFFHVYLRTRLPSQSNRVFTAEDGTVRLSRNVGKNYHYSLRNNPEKRRSQSNYLPIQVKLIGFYNVDGMCLLRGTNWVYK